MPKDRGQDRERIEVGETFDRLAIAQQKAVHVGPFGDIASDRDVKPELNEHQVPVTAPTVDLGAQVREAAPDALELCLCGLDADHGSCEWLHEDHLIVQEFR